MPPRATRSPRRAAPTPNKPPLYPPGLGFTPEANKIPAHIAPTPTPTRSGALPCIAYVVLYHVAFIGALLLWHSSKHGFNPTQAFLAVFCVINAWIAVCELALLFYPGLIQQQHADYTAKYGVGVLPPVFLFERVHFTELLSLKYWAFMWSQYAALDPSYADTTSFGYCVDVGNGVTTLLPTIIFAIGMTRHVLEARVLGMLGIVKFWQEMYGTYVYFFQYFNNRRFERAPRAHMWGIVVPANGIWILFPAVGMWACSRLILEGSFTVFGWPEIQPEIQLPSAAQKILSFFDTWAPSFVERLPKPTSAP